ncbi:MAG: class I SAM-dependent methyltransferase [Myxococcota bacterium]|nr:class I SAM-dependent methyltransferase [Myxococcota bacterium]
MGLPVILPGMALRDFLKPRFLDWAMRMMDDLRPEALEAAEGEVLEVGFGTGRNLEHYGSGVRSLTAVDPMDASSVPKVGERIARAPFPLERCTLRADGELPFDAGRFDSIVTTWTLCSIPEVARALAEMRRVLKPGGRYVFIEHGRAPGDTTARWQDRLNPIWCRLSDGCNINRRIDRLVEAGGFELTSFERFRAKGPGLLAHMYRGVATHSS